MCPGQARAGSEVRVATKGAAGGPGAVVAGHRPDAHGCKQMKAERARAIASSERASELTARMERKGTVTTRGRHAPPTPRALPCEAVSLYLLLLQGQARIAAFSVTERRGHHAATPGFASSRRSLSIKVQPRTRSGRARQTRPPCPLAQGSTLNTRARSPWSRG